MPRSPQVRPVFLQAGASPRGRAFAARWAELIFASGGSKAESIAFTTDIRSRMDAIGRPSQECAVLNSLGVMLGETEAIAQDRLAQLDALADSDLILAHNSTMVGADLGRHQTPDAVAAAQGNAGISGIDDALRQRAASSGSSYAATVRKPRSVMVGTPISVADQMQDLFEAGACDGFTVWPTVSPIMFEEFGRLLVPELQKRGLVQREYATGTLRDKLQNL